MLNKMMGYAFKLLIMLKLLIVVITVLCLSVCTKDRYSVVELKQEMSIDSYPDSSFFSEIRCMQYYKDSIYLLDVKRRDIVALDLNLDKMHIIEKYDSQTMDILETFDFSDLPFVQENLVYFFSKSEDDNSYYVTVNDAYLESGKLYLLCATFVPQYEVKTLLEIDILSVPMSVNRICRLPGDVYNCICVSPTGLLYAFGDKCLLERFKL